MKYLKKTFFNNFIDLRRQFYIIKRLVPLENLIIFV
jgi:hypothetical protein